VIVVGSATFTIRDVDEPGVHFAGNLWALDHSRIEIPDGATIDWSPPLPGPVDGWSWPPDDAVGIFQRATIDRSEVLLWPMLVRSGSDLTLRDIPDEGWVVVGLYLPGSARISRLENDVFVGDRELDLGDRRLRLVNANVDTWNLYPQNDAVVEVAGSVIGEVLSFGNSVTRIRDTTVDGTGGFLGSRDQSRLELVDSTVTCTVEAAGDSLLTLRHSQVHPYPADPTGAFTRFAAWDDARLLADHTTVDTAGRSLTAARDLSLPLPPRRSTHGPRRIP
jgi:hypothetical protein